MKTFIEGKFVNLGIIESTSSEFNEWHSMTLDAESAFNTTSMHRVPLTTDQQLSYYRSLGSSDLLLGVAKHDGIFLGVMSIKSTCQYARRGGHATVFDKRKSWDLMHVFESHYLLFRHAFESLNYHSVHGGSIDPNQSLFLKKFFGFQAEGVLRDAHYRAGTYHDVHLHSLLKSEFSKAKASLEEAIYGCSLK